MIGKDMDIHHLQTFRVLATTLNFSQTAKQLGYVQSSVSAQIRALEIELGVKLFDRLSKSTVLTEAGKSLVPYAERVLALIEEAKSIVSQSNQLVGTITFGAPETISTYQLPRLFRSIQKNLPHVHLILRPLSFSELQRSVISGEIDIAIILDDYLASPSLEFERLSIEQLVVVAASGHPLTNEPIIGPIHIVNETLLLTEIGCRYRELFEQAIADARCRLNYKQEFSSVEAIKQCVIAGMGIALLPAMAVQPELANGSLIALNWQPELNIEVRLIWHREKWLSPVLRAFIELTREVLATLNDG
jgi:DNA-binding transcriptional LysR family regulator